MSLIFCWTCFWLFWIKECYEHLIDIFVGVFQFSWINIWVLLCHQPNSSPGWTLSVAGDSGVWILTKLLLIVFSFNHFSAMWYFIVLLFIINFLSFAYQLHFALLFSFPSHNLPSISPPTVSTPLFRKGQASHGSQYITSSWF